MAEKLADALSAFHQGGNNEKELGTTIEQPDRKLRIGIIGTGGIAHLHAQRYAKFPDVDMVALCDIVPGKAEAFGKTFGFDKAKCYTDHKVMIEKEKLDGVSICTYNSAHAPCTVDCLNKGVNVLVEKPMSVTVEEAADMIRAEKKSGKVLTVGFQPRFDPNMRKIKEMVQEGLLGDVYYIQTGGGRRRGIPSGSGGSFIRKETAGIGAMGDIGCYSLDMVLNAVGYPKPLTITGYKSSLFGTKPEFLRDPQFASVFGVEDFAAAFIRMEGGIIMDFRISWAMHANNPGDTLLLGTKGALRVPATDCWNGEVGPLTYYSDLSGVPVDTIIPKARPVDHFDRKIRSFLNAVKTGGPSPIPSGEIFLNQVYINGILDSAELGKEITVKIPKI